MLPCALAAHAPLPQPSSDDPDLVSTKFTQAREAFYHRERADAAKKFYSCPLCNTFPLPLSFLLPASSSLLAFSCFYFSNLQMHWVYSPTSLFSIQFKTWAMHTPLGSKLRERGEVLINDSLRRPPEVSSFSNKADTPVRLL